MDTATWITTATIQMIFVRLCRVLYALARDTNRFLLKKNAQLNAYIANPAINASIAYDDVITGIWRYLARTTAFNNIVAVSMFTE